MTDLQVGNFYVNNLNRKTKFYYIIGKLYDYYDYVLWDAAQGTIDYYDMRRLIDNTPFLMIDEDVEKFKLRIRIYYELISKFKFIKNLRCKSKEKMILIPYQKLDRNLDPILLGEMKDSIFFNRMLSFFNFLLKLF